MSPFGLENIEQEDGENGGVEVRSVFEEMEALELASRIDLVEDPDRRRVAQAVAKVLETITKKTAVSAETL